MPSLRSAIRAQPLTCFAGRGSIFRKFLDFFRTFDAGEFDSSRARAPPNRATASVIAGDGEKGNLDTKPTRSLRATALALDQPGFFGSRLDRRRYAFLMLNEEEQVTQLLHRMSKGDAAAEEALLENIYQDLKHAAHLLLRSERYAQTFQTTALVHEAFLRIPRQGINWQNRKHFYAVAARAMRRILIDQARARLADKRPDPKQRIELRDAPAQDRDDPALLIAIDQALAKLGVQDPRQAKIVEMRFFGGMTEEEVAEILKLSTRTVKREWQFARLWLSNELQEIDGSA